MHNNHIRITYDNNLGTSPGSCTGVSYTTNTGGGGARRPLIAEESHSED